MLVQIYAIQPLEKVKLIICIFARSLRNNQAEQYTTRSYLSDEMNHSVVG